LVGPQGPYLDARIGDDIISEKEPAQFRPARLATRKHRSSSISASEKKSGDSRDGWRRVENGKESENRGEDGGSLDEKMRGVRTPELRVVNIDV
jgi:hypothetical protein